MRPYVLHEFPQHESPSGEGYHLETNEIFPDGTIVSLVLESKNKHKATKWRKATYPYTEIDDRSLTRDLPAQTRSEELFFRIVEYLPKPRDRYVVERVRGDAYVYAPCSDHWWFEDHGRGNGTEISLYLDSEKKRSRYFPIAHTDVLDDARDPPSRQLRLDLRLEKITREEYDVKLKELNKEYAEVKEKLRQERDNKYPLGETVKVRVEPDPEETVHKESAFLKPGDRITCKRKNIHFVGDPESTHQEPEGKARCVTTWSGTLLDRSVVKWIKRGHLVRAVVALRRGVSSVFYLSIVDVLPNDCLLGVLRSYYLQTDMTAAALVGNYFVVRRDDVTEIPHTWDDNADIEKKVEAAKQSEGLAMTGVTALE